MIHVPWLTTSHNKSTMSLTELIDVFPTMVSLAGLPVPPEVEGTDLSPLLLDPTKSLKDAAYHQYPACNTRSFNSTRDACNNTPKDQFDYFGYSGTRAATPLPLSLHPSYMLLPSSSN